MGYVTLFGLVPQTPALRSLWGSHPLRVDTTFQETQDSLCYLVAEPHKWPLVLGCIWRYQELCDKGWAPSPLCTATWEFPK